VSYSKRSLLSDRRVLLVIKKKEPNIVIVVDCWSFRYVSVASDWLHICKCDGSSDGANNPNRNIVSLLILLRKKRDFILCEILVFTAMKIWLCFWAMILYILVVTNISVEPNYLIFRKQIYFTKSSPWHLDFFSTITEVSYFDNYYGKNLHQYFRG
jgi:hypothetical protein